jgi:hypothetical protein
MSAEHHTERESVPGEFEFSLVFGAFKAKFERAKEEQSQLKKYRMFTIDQIDSAPDSLVRFRLVDADLVDNLQAAAQNPERVIDVALPIAIPDSQNPVLISDSPFAGEQKDYFVLYRQDGPVIVDAERMQAEVIEPNPDFVNLALWAEPVPVSKPTEHES